MVPAAGSSRRMGRDKLMADLDGAPVLVRTLRVLAATGLARVVVGVRAAERAALATRVPAHLDGMEVRLVEGGETRHETVGRCLAALPADADHVLVHDAARPYCSPALVVRVQREAEACGAAASAWPIVDTVHRATPDGTVVETLERAGLWCAQTPQGFRRDILVAAHAAARGGYTDDAGLCAAAGQMVRLVHGERANVKLTFPEDLPAAPLPLAVGQGYDVHRLVADRPLVLGGVRIPHDRGLGGHSDADALCHALADAVLGAAGLGDIGQHFPPDDPAFAGADSLELLKHCVALAAQHRWRPAQADCLVIAERPRLAPHVPAMRQRLAAALSLDPERVNVKAGTNEGLGSLGREEGIAAQAVVLLRRLPV